MLLAPALMLTFMKLIWIKSWSCPNPENLGEANKLAGEYICKSVLPVKTIEKFLSSKLAEWNSYMQTDNKEQFEKERYFLNI